jgi:prepilin-type N-terminal cleavage/methylation domain-containing protein
MLKKILRSNRLNQKGFTLIEILIATAISGILALGISIAISQITTVNANSTARMEAIKQIELSIDRIRVDVQMAQEIYTSDPDPSPNANVFLALKWTEWNNTSHSIKYYWDTTNQLSRLPSEGTLNAIAKNIDSRPAVVLPNSSYLRITLSATVGTYRPATETRVFEVKRRAGS